MAVNQTFIVEEDTIEIDVDALTGYALPPITEDLDITPTKQTQTYKHAEGTNTYYDEVIVEPIPAEYIIPRGTQEITENGEFDVTEKASVLVNVETKNFDVFNVQQVINGATSELLINDAGVGAGIDMYLGEVKAGDYQKLFLVEE